MKIKQALNILKASDNKLTFTGSFFHPASTKFTRTSIFLVDVCWALATVSGTNFVYVALANRFTARGSCFSELKFKFQLKPVQNYGLCELTRQLSQQGPEAHSASFFNLHVIGSQQMSCLLHSSNVPQSHSSPSSTIAFPQFLRISS